jgi:hypothetical protein
MRNRGTRLVVEGCYIGVVGALAVTGSVQQQAVYYAVAVLLSLPLGIAALVGCFGGYALLNAIGGMLGSGSGPGSWVVTGSAVLNAVLLCGAAVGNVLILRRRSRPSRPAAPVGSNWRPPMRR